jgi:hypothetical protein
MQGKHKAVPIPNNTTSNKTDYSPPSSAKAENAWSHPSTLPHAIMGLCEMLISRYTMFSSSSSSSSSPLPPPPPSSS